MADRSNWLRVLAQASGQQGRPHLGECPDCGLPRLQVRFIVNPDTRVGYALLWCAACLRGVLVSRDRAPEGMPVRLLDDPLSTEGVPEFLRHE